VRVLAVQALLVPIDPAESDCLTLTDRKRLHRLPVEAPLVLDAPAVRELGEIDSLQQPLQVWEELVEAGRVVGERGEYQSGGRDMVAQFSLLDSVSFSSMQSKWNILTVSKQNT
jgi:hypothetical protein